MRSRAVRLTLTLLAVGALAAAAYHSWNIDRRTRAAGASLRSVNYTLNDASRQTLELRAAQQAYVAAGQSEQFWITKVTESISSLQNTLSTLRASQLSANAQASVEAAAQALEDLGRVDRRARGYAASGQKLLASDLIFSDGLDRTQQMLAALDAARTSEESAAGVALSAARQELLLTATAGIGAAVIALLLLTPSGTRAEEPVSIAPVVAPSVQVSAARNTDRVVKKHPEGEPKPVATPTSSAAVPVPPKGMPELQDVADVCTQLARVADTGTLPVLLQRTAVALNAAGVVLWVATPDGDELVAVASHGYAENVLARMGPLGRDAENVTAAAFRTGLLQIVKGDVMSNGAIAAPLVNNSGCVGVMSAEVRNDGEREPARLAFATIVAAQLATLVAPAARSENRAAL